MEKTPNCPQCGALIKQDAPAGLCPSCLMLLNLKTETLFTGGTPAAEPPLPPERIAPHFPQLEILECLGRGGMGVVYKARQKSLNRLVALKLVAPERVSDARFAERFTREAHALAALNHPHIVTVYDFGQAGGFYFLLMEFVDGVNLRQLLGARKLTPEEGLTIVPPLCEALQYAHDHGIVHRDIKPENLLLDKAGRVKVADFGIARLLGAGSASTGLSETQPAGTPQYMAPEQKSKPQTADSRADIYSLGVVFYEVLTGELPGRKVQPPSSKVRIDVRLDEIVLRALENSPELRYQTAAELRTEIETVASAPISSQRDAIQDGFSLLSRIGSGFHRHAGLLFGLGLLVGALIVGWFLLKETNRAHREQYALIAARIPELQQQWTVAKSREAVARQTLNWFQTRSTNGQRGDELLESQKRLRELQQNVDSAIQQGRDADAQIAATQEALGQLRYPFARVLWPVSLLLAGGFFMIFQRSARRSPAWGIVAISAPVVIALLGLLVFGSFSERRAPAETEEEKAKERGGVQSSNQASADAPAATSP